MIHDANAQAVGQAQVVRKASNREKFNTGHQRWGWTKFVSLEEALPCIMGDSVLIQVEVAVREQDVGEASTFTFRCVHVCAVVRAYVCACVSSVEFCLCADA